MSEEYVGMTPLRQPRARSVLIPRSSFLIPHFAVLLAYLLASIVFTWPQVLDLGGSLVNGADNRQTIWNFWMLRHSLFDLHTWPLQTDLIYWPGGTSLYLHTYTLDLNLLVLPITLTAGPVVAYNLAVLFVCVASGYAMYRLGWMLSGSALAGFVAGFALTFNAWHVTRLWGQLSLASFQWPLLYMLFLLRREGRGWVNALGAGVALALTYMAGQYLVLYLALFTALWALNRGLERGVPWRARAATLGRAVGAAGVAGLLVSPLLVGLLTSAQSGTFLVPTFAETLTFSADPLAYFVPGPYSTVFGAWSTPIYANHVWGTIPLEKMVFPGWSLWVLGIFGLGRAWPQTRLWLNLLVVSFVLSLGPVLHAAGQGLPVPLPYLLFYQLPGVEVSRTPVRFALLVQIALAVGLAYGLAFLLRRLRGPQGLALLPSRTHVLEFQVPSVRPLLLVGGLLALITVEQAIIPFAMGPASISPFYTALAQSADRSALLEVPIGDPPGPYQSDYLLAQTVHGRPIIGGYISRNRMDPFIEGSPGIREFRYIGGPPDIVTQASGSQPTVPPLASAARALLQANHIGTIILHTDQLTDTLTLSATAALAAQISGSSPVYEGDNLRAYTVTGPPDPAQVVLQLGAGWSAAGVEKGATAVGRWADQGAEILITAFAAHTVQVDIDAGWPAGPHGLQIERGAEVVGLWTPREAPGRYTTLPFPVATGVTTLRLRSDAPALALPKLTPFDKAQLYAILRVTGVRITLQDR